jgi:hypothetical protein
MIEEMYEDLKKSSTNAEGEHQGRMSVAETPLKDDGFSF